MPSSTTSSHAPQQLNLNKRRKLQLRSPSFRGLMPSPKTKGISSSAIDKKRDSDKPRPPTKMTRTVSKDDQLLMRGANPRTGVVSPWVLTSRENSDDYIESKASPGPSKLQGSWRQDKHGWTFVQSNAPESPERDLRQIAFANSRQIDNRLDADSLERIERYRREVEKATNTEMGNPKFMDPSAPPTPRALTPESPSSPPPSLFKIRRKAIGSGGDKRNVSNDTVIRYGNAESAFLKEPTKIQHQVQIKTPGVSPNRSPSDSKAGYAHQIADDPFLEQRPRGIFQNHVLRSSRRIYENHQEHGLGDTHRLSRNPLGTGYRAFYDHRLEFQTPRQLPSPTTIPYSSRPLAIYHRQISPLPRPYVSQIRKHRPNLHRPEYRTGEILDNKRRWTENSAMMNPKTLHPHAEIEEVLLDTQTTGPVLSRQRAMDALTTTSTTTTQSAIDAGTSPLRPRLERTDGKQLVPQTTRLVTKRHEGNKPIQDPQGLKAPQLTTSTLVYQEPTSKNVHQNLRTPAATPACMSATKETIWSAAATAAGSAMLSHRVVSGGARKISPKGERCLEEDYNGWVVTFSGQEIEQKQASQRPHVAPCEKRAYSCLGKTTGHDESDEQSCLEDEENQRVLRESKGRLEQSRTGSCVHDRKISRRKSHVTRDSPQGLPKESLLTSVRRSSLIQRVLMGCFNFQKVSSCRSMLASSPSRDVSGSHTPSTCLAQKTLSRLKSMCEHVWSTLGPGSTALHVLGSGEAASSDTYWHAVKDIGTAMAYLVALGNVLLIVWRVVRLILGAVRIFAMPLKILWIVYRWWFIGT